MAGIGEALRSTRERRGLSIDQVAQDTRISPRFLEALEAEQFHELPAPVYVRGFLRSYANYLKIEPQPLLDQLIGGTMASPGATEGYVGANGRSQTMARRNDPFQRGGVVAAPAAPPQPAAPAAEPPPEEEGWAPEPLVPFSPRPADHGYIPGSDLMEAPEQEYEEYAEPEPVYRPRTAGVLAERPPGPNEPGVPRKVALFGGAVAAVLGFLLLAVFLTRGDDEGTNNAAATSGDTPVVTPGTVIPLTSRTATTTTTSTAASATASVTASTTGTVSATTTPNGATPQPTTSGSASTTTPTPTATATQAPAATATPTTFVPPPTPTVAAIQPENSSFGECNPTGTGSYDCGAPPYRVICYTPLGFPQNRNWWVDVDRSFGALPPGWKEFDGLVNNGQIINAGQTLCATP